MAQLLLALPNALIQFNIKAMPQDIPAAPIWHDRFMIGAIVLSIGMHVAIVAALAQSAKSTPPQIKPLRPIMMVLIKSVPKKPLPQPLPSVAMAKGAPSALLPPIAKPQPSIILKPANVQALAQRIAKAEPKFAPKSKVKPKPKSVPQHISKLKPKSKPKLKSKPVPKPILKPISKATKRTVLKHSRRAPLPVLDTATEPAVSSHVNRPITSVRPIAHKTISPEHSVWQPPIKATSLAIKHSVGISRLSERHLPTNARFASNHNEKVNAASTRSVPMASSPPTAAPAYLNNPRPTYPRMAQRAHMEGRCILEVAVDANGIPHSVRILHSSGYSILDQAAVSAVSHWRFVPASRGGKAVAAVVEVPIRFHLSD